MSKAKKYFILLLGMQILFAHANIAHAISGDDPTKGVTQYTGVQSQIEEFLCAPTNNNQGATPSITDAGKGTGSGTGATSGKTSEQLSYEAGNRNTAKYDLYNCINRIYRFAIVLAAAIGVLFIVIAGYLYMSSEGNNESITKAKEILVTTITSFVILFMGYIFLRAINPELIEFKNIQPPSVALLRATNTPEQIREQVEALQKTGQIPDEGNGGGNTAIIASSGIAGCQSCDDYSKYFKYNSTQKPGKNTWLNRDVITYLQQVKNLYPNFTVTEAYPPTVNHADACHFNGTCVDIVASNNSKLEIENLCTALKEASSNVWSLGDAQSQLTWNIQILNEYPSSMNPFKCGIAANQYKTTTGGHFHIKVRHQ